MKPIFLLILFLIFLPSIAVAGSEEDALDEFINLDCNNDSKINISEFEEFANIPAEDSFWKGYSIEDILICEFEHIDENNDGFLDFNEFKILQ